MTALRPSVAWSDSVNLLLNLVGAAFAYRAAAANQTLQYATFGLLSVSIASISGIIRFGFSDTSDTDSINGNLADLVAFVGLPLVGRSFLETFSKDRASQFDSNLVPIILSLLSIEAISRPWLDSTSNPIRNVLTVLVNFVFFIAPVFIASYRHKEWCGITAATLYVLAGVVIGANLDDVKLGMRCVNWFHLCIAVAGALLGISLHRIDSIMRDSSSHAAPASQSKALI